MGLKDIVPQKSTVLPGLEVLTENAEPESNNEGKKIDRWSMYGSNGLHSSKMSTSHQKTKTKQKNKNKTNPKLY